MRALALSGFGPSASDRVKAESTATGLEATLLPSLQDAAPPLTVTTGASLTAVTTTLAVSVPEE